jgi:hypothetical protein
MLAADPQPIPRALKNFARHAHKPGGVSYAHSDPLRLARKRAQSHERLRVQPTSLRQVEDFSTTALSSPTHVGEVARREAA